MLLYHGFLARLLFENAAERIDIFARDRLEDDPLTIFHEIDAGAWFDAVLSSNFSVRWVAPLSRLVSLGARESPSPDREFPLANRPVERPGFRSFYRRRPA